MLLPPRPCLIEHYESTSANTQVDKHLCRLLDYRLFVVGLYNVLEYPIIRPAYLG